MGLFGGGHNRLWWTICLPYWRIASIGASIILTACAQTSKVDVNTAFAQFYPEEGAKYKPHVGQIRWTTIDATICTRPASGSSTNRCENLGPNAKISIVGLQQGYIELTDATIPDGHAYCHVTSGDHSGYKQCSILLADTTDVDPGSALAECRRRGDPRVGMTAKQVEATCWGRPLKVNRHESTGGIMDQYVYGPGRYVYLQNGVVISISTSGTIR
jgi:hypothetical protein